MGSRTEWKEPIVDDDAGNPDAFDAPDPPDRGWDLAPYLGDETVDDPATFDTAAAEHVPDRLIGQVLEGKYTIEKLIGVGAHGRVYRAIQAPIGRPVAVKVLHLSLEEKRLAELRERFSREATLGGRLQHPNIVVVHDFGYLDQGNCFIVLELLRGKTLKRIMRGGPVAASRAVPLLQQMARGLRYAHSEGVVHRDIKPGNMLVIPGEDGDERLKILDFGLVKLFEETKPTDEDQDEITGARFLGTPEYASPEQVRGHAVGPGADLYSVGVVAFKMLTGQHPFEAPSPAHYAIRHIENPVPAMTARAPDVQVPSELEGIVQRCLQKDPADRYPDSSALLQELEALQLTEKAAPDPPLPTEESGPVESPQPSTLLPNEANAGKRWTGAVAAIGGLLFAIAFGVLNVGKDVPGVPPSEVSSATASMLEGLWTGKSGQQSMILQIDLQRSGGLRATATVSEQGEAVTRFLVVQVDEGTPRKIRLLDKEQTVFQGNLQGRSIEGKNVDGETWLLSLD